MEEIRGIRGTKRFKSLSTFVTSLFLFTTVFNSVPGSSMSVAKAEQTTGGSNGIGQYQAIDVNWTRTKDVRQGSNFNVHNSDIKFDKYWQKDGSTYTMKPYSQIDQNGTPNTDAAQGQEGIFLMRNLFSNEQKTVVFDYDSLTKTMGATDTNVWDGKGSNPYSDYRKGVVYDYLNTQPGDYYHLKDIQNPKNPTTDIKRESDFTIDTYPDFATWQYMTYNNSTRGYDQMRLFKGEYTINDGDLDKYNYYITSGDNKDNILAIDDTMMVLVDGIPTNLNYTTANYTNTTVKLKNGNKTYDMKFNQAENCRKENNLPITCDLSTAEGNRHAAYSVFTDTLHVHLADEIQDSVKLNGTEGTKVLGDITSNMVAQGGTNHKIEVIASDYNLSGGMTKLNIIKVAKPQTELVKDAYVGDTLVASSSDDTSSTVKSTDKISYKFTYKNDGETPVYDILFEDDLLKATVGVKNGTNTFAVNGKTYTAADFKVEKYKADGTVEKSGDGSLLQGEDNKLNKGEYIVVSSDELTHTPTAAEVTAGKVENTVTSSSSYKGYYKEERITDKADAKVTVKVNDNPVLDVIKEAYQDDSYNNIVASSETTNISDKAEVVNGKDVYYKFKIKNIGDSTLNNLKITDPKFSVNITSQKYYNDNEQNLDKSNLVIEKYDEDGNKVTGESGLSALNDLKPGYSLIIYDKTNIIKSKVNGKFTNTVNVIGTSENGKTVEDNATVTVNPKNPQIQVVKTAFTDTQTEKSVNSVSVGQKVYYKFETTNTSDCDLSDITFTDEQFNGTDTLKVSSDGVFINDEKQTDTSIEVIKTDVQGNSTKGGLELLNSLKVGEKIVFTDINDLYRMISSEDVNNELSNTVKVEGIYKSNPNDPGTPVSDKNTVTVKATENPSIKIIKEAYADQNYKSLVASSQSDVVSNNGAIDYDGTAYYKFRIVNTGNCTLKNITLNDSQIGVSIDSTTDKNSLKIEKYDPNGNVIEGQSGVAALKELHSGESIVVYDNTYIKKDNIKDSFKNTVKVSSKSPSGNDVTDNATVTVNPKDAQIDVTKKAFTDVATQASVDSALINQKVYYQFTAKNIGNVDLTNVTFTDNKFNGKDDLKITNEGIYINNNKVSTDNLELIKYDENGYQIDKGGLELLDSLKVGEKITFIDTSNVYRTLSIDDGYTKISNTVEGTGEYKAPSGEDKTVKDSDTVYVTPKPTIPNSDDVKPDSTKVKIKAQKQALVSGEIVADSTDSSLMKKINVGKIIKYNLIAINNGGEALKDISITDNELGVVITKDSVTKNGVTINESNTFKIAKYNADGSLKVAGGFKDISSILSELQSGEKIVVSDESLLIYPTKDSEIVNNEVVVKGHSESKDPEDSAKVTVPVVDTKVDIVKNVYKITRDGNTIYEQKGQDKTEDKNAPLDVRVYPGDKVQYSYKITNNTEIKVDNLLIKDVLTNPDVASFTNVTNWTFVKDGQKFDDKSFSLDAGESIDVLSNEWTVPDNCKRNVINKVDLYQKGDNGVEKFINTDNAKIIVYPKVYVNMDCTDDPNKEFYVTVKGDNGFETSMYIKDKDKVDISDYLDFDVNYTVTETVPMNFEYRKHDDENGIDIEKGVDIEGNKKELKNLTFNLDTVVSPENITLHNIKKDSEEFQSDDDATNTLVYKEN